MLVGADEDRRFKCCVASFEGRGWTAHDVKIVGAGRWDRRRGRAGVRQRLGGTGVLFWLGPVLEAVILGSGRTALMLLMTIGWSRIVRSSADGLRADLSELSAFGDLCHVCCSCHSDSSRVMCLDIVQSIVQIRQFAEDRVDGRIWEMLLDGKLKETLVRWNVRQGLKTNFGEEALHIVSLW